MRETVVSGVEALYLERVYTILLEGPVVYSKIGLCIVSERNNVTSHFFVIIRLLAHQKATESVSLSAFKK